MNVIVRSHTTGFFSTCTVTIYDIVEFLQENKKYPLKIDGRNILSWYKKSDESGSIFNDYFLENTDEIMAYDYFTDINEYFSEGTEIQFCDFSKLRYDMINPIIKNYFSPSKEILENLSNLETKYTHDFENICVLFYRGNDKSREMLLCSYEEMYKIALEIKSKNSKIMFLLQSDETEFIEYMTLKFPDCSFYFKDEIRHINKSNTTVDIVYRNLNNQFSKYYLSITLYMSKCRYIVCESGNCSLWIMLFRNNSDGLFQHLDGRWIRN